MGGLADRRTTADCDRAVDHGSRWHRPGNGGVAADVTGSTAIA